MRTPWMTLAGLAALALTCGDALREDVLYCEEAIAHLQDCCPGFTGARISCIYDSSGCDTIVPDIGTDRSQCISRVPCADLIASGSCDGIRQTSTLELLTVCP